MIKYPIKEEISSSEHNEKTNKVEHESKKTEVPIKKSKYRPSYFTPKIKFSQEEDRLLMNAVKELGTSVWTDIASKVPGRNARQCRERWCNYLNPSLISAPWSPEEDLFLLQKRQDLGLHWQSISTFFPNRSKNSIKNRYSILIRRQNKKNKKFKNKPEAKHQNYQNNNNQLLSHSKEIQMSSKIPAIFNLDEDFTELDEFIFLNDEKNYSQNQHIFGVNDTKSIFDVYN